MIGVIIAATTATANKALEYTLAPTISPLDLLEPVLVPFPLGVLEEPGGVGGAYVDASL